MIDERLPPQSAEAEEAVLGSCLIDPDAVGRVASLLQPVDFYDEARGWIFAAMLALRDGNVAVDYLTVCDELERVGRQVSPAYLMDLINAVPTSVHAEHYARIVENASTRRRMLDVASNIAVWAHDESLDPADVHGKALAAVSAVRRLSDGLSVPLSAAVSDYYNRVEAMTLRGGKGLELPMGFKDLDKFFRGLAPTDVVIVAARSSTGKTAFVLNVARNLARLGATTAYFSAEMSKEQIVERFMAAESNIPASVIRRAAMADSEWGGFMKATGTLSDCGIYLCDRRGLTPAFVRSEFMRLEAERRIDVIIVDYLQRMRSGMRAKDRFHEVTELSGALKDLAGELKRPVVVVSQLSRAAEARASKEPQLSDLYESGHLEQDADVVIFLYRDELYDQDTDRRGLCDVIVAKDRNGPLGRCTLLFEKELVRFRDVTVQRTPLEEVY